MKIGFIGCVESSKLALQTLLSIKEVKVSCVVTKEKSKINADFVDLTDLCNEHKIPYHFEKIKEKEATLNFLKSHDLDVIYCIGWSHLLNKDVITLTPKGVIGFHPAKIPQNRGRHPIIWALSLGLEQTASSFFKMDEGADSGDILSQELVNIEKSDNAKTLYNKIMDTALEQIKKFSVDLANNTATFIQQDHSQATYWRKRSRKDGVIDFRMNASSIYNLVRALTDPYPGAEFIFNEEYFRVYSSEVSSNEFAQNIEPGKILDKKDNALLVKCAQKEAIWLRDIQGSNLPSVGEFI